MKNSGLKSMEFKEMRIYLPKNYQKQDRRYFRKKVLKIPNLKIKELHDVFATENGFIIRNYSLIKPLVKESIYRYFSHYISFIIEGLSKYNKAKKNNLYRLEDDQNYFIIASPWSSFNHFIGYYHWILDSIPRLIEVYNKISNPTLIIWDFFLKFDFLKKSLLPFKDLKLKIIPNNSLVHTKKLFLPELKHYCYFYNRENLDKIRNIYLNYFSGLSSFNSRVYITRKNSNRRKIINEVEVENIFKKYDFEILDCDIVPFEKQISIISHANTLASIHGGALTNILFLPPKSKVLEFHRRKKTPFDHHSKVYWYLCCSLGHEYYHQICEPIGINKTSFFQADFYIDIHELERNICLILKTS